jgi:hypothetical protein
MKNLKKIMLSVAIVTLGIFLIDNTISASTETCYCVNGYEAAGECINICWNLYEAECVNVILWSHGCQYEDCVSFWKFECDNEAKGGLTTIWHYCWDCYIY